MDDREQESTKPQEIQLGQKYDRVLEQFLPSEFRNVSDTVYITEVGCGTSFALPSFVRVVGNKIHYRGIDKDSLHINGAKLYNKDLADQNPNITFEVADARESEVIGDKEDINDMVIMRNPQVEGSYADLSTNSSTPEDWEKIIDNTVKSIRIGGYIFATANIERDLKILTNHLEKLKVTFTEFKQEISPSLKAATFPERWVSVIKIIAK